MNIYIHSGRILFLATTCSGNTDKTPEHLALREKYAVAGLQENFQQAVRVVRKNYPGLYDYINKEDYERLIAQLFAKITDLLSITECCQLPFSIYPQCSL